MKNKKWIMLLTLLAATTVLMYAQQFNPESDFTVVRNDEGNAVIITGYVGTGQIVSIPPQIRGLPVTIIGANAFERKNITRVTIPDSVTTIGNSAFSDCSGLTSVIIGNSVTTISDRAFWICRSLTSINIPNSVTTIGNSAFGGCTGLTSITIPNSVTTIGNSAFSGCSGLTSVTIGNSVTTIGYGVFEFCSNLASVTVHATTPPGGFSWLFHQTPNNIQIFVPEGSVAAYRAAEGWRRYANRISAIW